MRIESIMRILYGGAMTVTTTGGNDYDLVSNGILFINDPNDVCICKVKQNLDTFYVSTVIDGTTYSQVFKSWDQCFDYLFAFLPSPLYVGACFGSTVDFTNCRNEVEYLHTKNDNNNNNHVFYNKTALCFRRTDFELHGTRVRFVYTINFRLTKNTVVGLFANPDVAERARTKKCAIKLESDSRAEFIPF